MCVITQSTLDQPYWLHLERTTKQWHKIKFGDSQSDSHRHLSFAKARDVDIYNNGMNWFMRPREAFPSANSLGNKDLSTILTLRIKKKNNTLTKVHNRYIHKIKG